MRNIIICLLFCFLLAPGIELWISPRSDVLDSLLLTFLLAQRICEHLDTLPYRYWAPVSAPLHMGGNSTSNHQSGWVHGRSPKANRNNHRTEYLRQRATHLRVCLLPPVLLYRPKVACCVLVSGLLGYSNRDGWGWHSFRLPQFLLPADADGVCFIWHGGRVYSSDSNMLEEVPCAGIC